MLATYCFKSDYKEGVYMSLCACVFVSLCVYEKGGIVCLCVYVSVYVCVCVWDQVRYREV